MVVKTGARKTIKEGDSMTVSSTLAFASGIIIYRIASDIFKHFKNKK